jgi:predicted secreted Zn-dependent protease
MSRVPTISRAGLALAGLLTMLLAACGGDDPQTPTLEPSAPPATAVSAATPSADSPKVELVTTESTTNYTVSGTDTEAIFASIEANGPTDTVGQQGSGLTAVEWEYKWVGDESPSGACSIRELTITADITIELPKHGDESSLPESVRNNWQAYAKGVAAHEQRHVDIYLQGARDIQTAMEEVGVEANCDLLDAKIDGIWNDQQGRINGLQETFHSEEAARLAASRGPLEAQIEANRAQLQSLQAQIAALDQEMNQLRAELTVFDNEVASVDAQIKQINDQFPNELPDTIRDRLQSLIEQSNKLLVQYNQRVEDHNAAFYSRSTLSDEYDALLWETNQLVEQYNWTR